MTTIEQLYQLYLQHPVVSTDTRKISPGSIFFALKGENFNGNRFAQQAINAGAAFAVIDDENYHAGDEYLLVEDVLTTLQNLARYHRRQLTIPVIGLTGSNGKTTTKELINAVLCERFNTLATQGNLNNHIGVPLTILNINSTHEIAVIEMGANHQKEIELLCSIAQPSQGLITNVGKAHLEGFGGVEGVKKGKGELYDYLKTKEDDPNTAAFINSNDATLMEMQHARSLSNIIYYGRDSDNNLVNGYLIENSPFLTIEWIDSRSDQTHQVKTQLTGAYNLDNILAAICIGSYFKLSAEQINAGVEGYQPKNNRSQIVKTATNTLICDYYNANPSSMLVALDNIDKLTASRKVVILGDMFEMGDEAVREHQLVIEKAISTPVADRIFIGKEFFSNQKPEVQNDNVGQGATFYETVEDAIANLKSTPITNSTILIKGSRGMALERLVELF